MATETVLNWQVSARHLRERRKEILLHLPGCTHWYTTEEMAAEHIQDPEIRPATAEEAAQRTDQYGRTWRPCMDCARKLRSDPVLGRVFSSTYFAESYRA